MPSNLGWSSKAKANYINVKQEQIKISSKVLQASCHPLEKNHYLH